MKTRRDFCTTLAGSAVLAGYSGGATRSANASSPYQGYWLPEETEPHKRTFMQWPVSRNVHPDPVFLKMLQRSIANVANAISEFEPVVMLMDENGFGRSHTAGSG